MSVRVRLSRLLVWLVALLLVMVAVPVAEARDTQDLEGCAYRQSTGASASLAKELCWLDFSGATFTGENWSKKLGRYTLSFNLHQVRGRDDQVTVGNRAWDQAAFGHVRDGVSTFIPYPGDNTQPLIKTDQQDKLGNREVAVLLSDITLTQEDGTAVKDFSLYVADAEATTHDDILNIYREYLYVHDAGETSALSAQRITPAGYESACTSGFGPGSIRQAPAYGIAGGTYGFVCNSGRLDRGQRVGSFLVKVDRPEQLTIGTISPFHQAFAVAIALGRAGGEVAQQPADAAFESALAGTPTSFDFHLYTRFNGRETEIPTTVGQYSSYLRQGDLVFRSTGDTADSSTVLRRYRPEWTCTTETQTLTITEGSVPSGYTLRNDPSQGRSDLITANANNDPLYCQVRWIPRFQPAKVQLSKNVKGNAQDFQEVALRTFTFSYICQPPRGFARAYPGQQLRGSVVLAKGAQEEIAGLPAGSQCIFEEVDPNSQPGGQDLELDWSVGRKGSGKLPATSVTLVAGDNPVQATNTYNYRTGTVALSKHLDGEAAGDLSYPRTYTFSLTCDGTRISRRDIELTITGPGQTGRTEISGVPVERDCYLRPLTGLTREESQRYKFTGRTVTVDGAGVETTQEGPYSGSYKLRVPDGANPTRTVVDISAAYAYHVRDLKLVKELAGPAAAAPEVRNHAFTVAGKCSWGSGAKEFRQEIFSEARTPQPVVIPDVPVGAQCLVWEEDADVAGVRLLSTTVRGSDANDQARTLSNQQARTQPVITISPAVDSTQNRVVLRNTYDYQLGTVSVRKLVVNNVTGVEVPDTFTFNYHCGQRAVLNPNGNVEAVELRGTVEVPAGQARTLDVQVPYGNTCTFTENAPSLHGSGVAWSSDVASAEVTVGAPTQEVRVTNTFDPVGQGLTVNHQVRSHPELARPVEYSLECTTEQGRPIDLGQHARFSLDATTAVHKVPAQLLPAGSQCSLAEASPEPGQRHGDGGEFPITRTSRLQVGEDDREFAAANRVVVGEATVATVSHSYDYVYAGVSGTKEVAFDPATAQYIPQVRQQEKREREFNVSLRCTFPLGGAPTQVATTITDGAAVDFGRFPIGSQCEAAEATSSTAAGIELDRQVRVNGRSAPVRQQLRLGADTRVEFLNTYSRQLAPVTVNKVARIPGDITGHYARAGKQIGFHTHTFTLECWDPVQDLLADAPLLRRTGTITGPGTHTFSEVPVGLECHLRGDNFGDLFLELPEENLQATLRPSSVDWVVDKNDGTAQEDTDLDNDVTDSQFFAITADGEVVDLINNYEYVTTRLRMSKEVVAAPADFALLRREQEFSFTQQCKGVGYEHSTIGVGNRTLPATLRLADFRKTGSRDGKDVYTYTSPEVEVPLGAWCTFSESTPAGLPAQLQWQAPPAVEQRADGTASWDFSNVFTRRLAPVRFVHTHTGYLTGADEAGYTGTVRCGDATWTIRRNLQEATAANAEVLELPVDVECQWDISDSPALRPNPNLEVTAGARTPLISFGQPAQTLPRPQEVTAAMKQTTFDFRVPVADSALTLSAEAIFLRDRMNVVLEKLEVGGQGQDYDFHTTCGTVDGRQDFRMRAGQQVVIEDIVVNQDCQLYERSGAVLQLGELAPDTRLANARAEKDFLAYRVLPVADAADTTTGSDSAAAARWTLVARNVFPRLSLDKNIAGPTVGGVTILPNGATTMEVTYTVTNTGGTGVRDLVLSDPQVGEVGRVEHLAVGQSRQFTVAVDISATPQGKIESTATVSGVPDLGGEVNASATAAALRLSSVLPETGQRALVLVLLLGLAAALYGLYQRRNRD
ncbi:DUF5979 domain-containing protein [Corynebacterium lizhenjunii]|uniref:DUF5979 domain-containing protein n=1 Tax=Corynebacterium lizhenjunii TaxID=2709394 RepID=UPI0013EA00A4|nr:DUF5979 domain-containing protein [Corynebacterium lizhenjunii]